MKFRFLFLAGALSLSCKGSKDNHDENTSGSDTTSQNSVGSTQTGATSLNSSSSTAPGASSTSIPEIKQSCEERAQAYQKHLETSWPSAETHGGLSFAVRSADCPPYRGSIGNARPGENLTPDMKVHAGAYSQFLIAAAMFQLENEKKLAVDDLLSKYLPDIKNAEQVTLRQIMSQATGYVDYSADKAWISPFMAAPDTPVDASTIVSRINELTPDIGDERRFNFSYSNYFLLGQVIEKVAAKSLDAYIGEKLLTPTGVTGIEIAPSTASSLAPGWDKDSQGATIEANSSYPPSLGWSAASLIGTPESIARWTEAVFRGETPLPPTAVGYMSRASVFESKRPFQYSYGTKIWEIQDGIYGYGHDAQLPGYAMFAMTDPFRKVTVVGAVTHRGQMQALRDAYRKFWSTAVQVDESMVLPAFETDPFLIFSP